MVSMNVVSHLDTNLMLPGDIPFLTPATIKSRIRGSKMVLVVEQSMIMTVWGCKICLLLMYNKLTFGLKQQLAVKIVAAYVALNWVVMEVLYLGVWCRPFNHYWQVPVENGKCSWNRELQRSNKVQSNVLRPCITSSPTRCSIYLPTS